MIALAATLLMVAGCLGGGALILRAARLADTLAPAENWSWSFALGLGLLGWLAFFLALAGQVQGPSFAIVCAAGLLGLPALPRLRPDHQPASPWTWLLLAGLAAVMAGDLAEALAPPADADTLAYHFILPKGILAAGRLHFIERAMDAASPQLIHGTYLAALAMGGEHAMTLWCMVSGWGIGLLTYGLARRFVARDWALAAALAMLSLPATLYGGGTGQVEPRTAMFVLVAALAAAQAFAGGGLRAAALAGLATGFFVASKYTGLLPAAVVGAILLAGRGGIRRAAIYGVTVIVAGFQWYVWNAWNTGDPVFPLLFGHLPYVAGTAWNAEQAAFMRESLAQAELAVPRSLGWLLAYPLSATLNGHPVFESGRTGFGPLPLLLLPFALVAAWHRRPDLRHPLVITAAVAVLGYILWFFLGPSQRVRHLLPLLPCLLVPLLVGAERTARAWGLVRPLAAGVGLALALQVAGQGIFAIKFAKFLASGGDREAFLERNVNHFALARWARALGPDERVLTQLREIGYVMDVPVFQANPFNQAQVEVRPDNTDPARFLRQLRMQGVTLVIAGPDDQAFAQPPYRMSETLVTAGCAEPAGVVESAPARSSRTLSLLAGEGRSRFHIFRIRPPGGTCPW